MLILGIDPGFASLGLALIEVTDAQRTVIIARVVTTEKASAKRHLLASDDNLDRARVLSAALDEIFRAHKVHLVAAESMSFARNAGAAHKLGIAWGVLAHALVTWRVPLVQDSPQSIKQKVAGDKTASKEVVQACVKKLVVVSQAARDQIQAIPRGRHEHVYDSIAAALVGARSDLAQAILTAAA